MTTREPLRPGERAFALALVLLSGFVFYEAYKISGFKGLTTGGVMPMLASGGMVLSSLSILARSVSRPASQQSQSLLSYLFPLQVVLFAALVAGYAVAIPYAGFMAASGGFMLNALRALWRRGPLWSLGISAVSMGAIYLLFRIVFQVVLPMGTLWR